MRCDECVLIGEAGRELAPDELQRRLQRCDECPHLGEGSEARAIAERLTTALARANRALRQTTSKLHQRERECAALGEALAGHEARLEQMESIQRAGARAADRELAARLEQIEQAHREIATLSTPCIRIWEGVLVVPLIGAFDDVRAGALRETVLAAIPEQRARCVILDLTGVADVDGATIGHLFTVTAAIRLLGARLVVVGVHPRVAARIVELGLPTPDFTIMRGLRDAVAAVVRGG